MTPFVHRSVRRHRIWIGILVASALPGLGAEGCTRAPDPYGPENVNVINADGGDLRVLVEDAALAGWSPDGKLIAVTSGGTESEAFTSGEVKAGPTAVEVIRPDGGGRRVLRRYSQPTLLGAAWSPDSRRLAVFDAPREGRLQRSTVSLLDLGPGGARTVVFARDQDLVDSASVAWSPDGRSVAFSAHDGPPAGGDFYFRPEVIVARVDGGPRRVPAPTEDGDADPVWMPDGRSLVVSAWDSTRDSYSLVEEITLDGRRRRLLRDATRPAAVSPDGRLIAVPAFGGSAPDLKRKVVVIPRRAGAPREIDVEPDVVAWSPDGRWLAIGGTEGLHVVSADGRKIRQIAGMDPPNAFTGIAWSPDSRRLAFSQDHEGYRTVDE